MAVYLVGKLRVKDWDWYREYRSVTEPLVESHGGKYLVKDVSPECVEGKDGNPDAAVMMEFPTREQALDFYRDPAYAPMIALRHKSGVETELLLIEGL